MSSAREVGERAIAGGELGSIALAERYVVLRTRALQRVVSFAPHGGGLRDVRTLAIHQVTNDDLPPEIDALALLRERMQPLDPQGVGMLTSRRVSALQLGAASFEQVSARVLVTAGLSNAVRVADTPGVLEGWGTINLVVQLDVALSDEALLEALTIVAEARTTAVLATGLRSRRGSGLATGTGTDCIAVLAPQRDGVGERYAGKHTAIGHVLGLATERALSRAIADWRQEYGV